MATPEEINPTAAAETTAPPVDAAPDTDPFDTGADSFDRAYVEKLRRESAAYRTKAKDAEPLLDTFGQYSEDDRQVWLQAAQIFAQDPKAGAEYLDQIAKAVLAEFEQPEPPAADEDDRPLTMAEFKRMQAEQTAQAAQAAEVSRIESEAKQLGYDPESADYVTLLTIASRLPSGSLEEAHAQMQAREQAIRDKVIAELQAEAEGSPKAPAGSGTEPSSAKEIASFSDAKAAAAARIAQMFAK